MKKKVALIGAAAVGVAGGVIYALESQWRRNHTAKADGNADGQSPDSENGSGKGSVAAKPDDRQDQRAATMGKNENATPAAESEHVIDDQGTHQSEAAQILLSIRDKAFDASDEKLALALGRPTEEISEWTSGSTSVDGDVLLKARTLAMHRGFEI